MKPTQPRIRPPGIVGLSFNVTTALKEKIDAAVLARNKGAAVRMNLGTWLATVLDDAADAALMENEDNDK